MGSESTICVTRDGDDLSLGATFQRKPRDRRAAQIIEREPGQPGLVTRLVERRSEAVLGPRAPLRCEQDDRARSARQYPMISQSNLQG